MERSLTGLPEPKSKGHEIANTGAAVAELVVASPPVRTASPSLSEVKGNSNAGMVSNASSSMTELPLHDHPSASATAPPLEHHRSSQGSIAESLGASTINSSSSTTPHQPMHESPSTPTPDPANNSPVPPVASIVDGSPPPSPESVQDSVSESNSEEAGTDDSRDSSVHQVNRNDDGADISSDGQQPLGVPTPKGGVTDRAPHPGRGPGNSKLFPSLSASTLRGRHGSSPLRHEASRSTSPTSINSGSSAPAALPSRGLAMLRQGNLTPPPIADALAGEHPEGVLSVRAVTPSLERVPVLGQSSAVEGDTAVLCEVEDNVQEDETPAPRQGEDSVPKDDTPAAPLKAEVRWRKGFESLRFAKPARSTVVKIPTLEERRRPPVIPRKKQEIEQGLEKEPETCAALLGTSFKGLPELVIPKIYMPDDVDGTKDMASPKASADESAEDGPEGVGPHPTIPADNTDTIASSEAEDQLGPLPGSMSFLSTPPSSSMSIIPCTDTELMQLGQSIAELRGEIESLEAASNAGPRIGGLAAAAAAAPSPLSVAATVPAPSANSSDLGLSSSEVSPAVSASPRSSPLNDRELMKLVARARLLNQPQKELDALISSKRSVLRKLSSAYLKGKVQVEHLQRKSAATAHLVPVIAEKDAPLTPTSMATASGVVPNDVDDRRKMLLEQQRNLIHAKRLFNVSPGHGIQFMIDTDLMPDPDVILANRRATPEDVERHQAACVTYLARLLYMEEGFSRSQVGKLLGQKNAFSSAILADYVGGLPLSECSLEEALRTLLSSVNLSVTNADARYRILKRLCSEWWARNQDRVESHEEERAISSPKGFRGIHAAPHRAKSRSGRSDSSKGTYTYREWWWDENTAIAIAQAALDLDAVLHDRSNASPPSKLLRKQDPFVKGVTHVVLQMNGVSPTEVFDPSLDAYCRALHESVQQSPLVNRDVDEPIYLYQYFQEQDALLEQEMAAFGSRPPRPAVMGADPSAVALPPAARSAAGHQQKRQTASSPHMGGVSSSLPHSNRSVWSRMRNSIRRRKSTNVSNSAPSDQQQGLMGKDLSGALEPSTPLSNIPQSPPAAVTSPTDRLRDSERNAKRWSWPKRR